MNRSSALVALMLAALAGPGCSSCEKESRPDPAATAASLEIAPGRLEPPWAWKPADPRYTAMPPGCRPLASPLRIDRPTQELAFFASPGDVGTLAVATGDPDPQTVTVTRGLVSLSTESPGKVRDVPWLHVASPPVMASSAKGWIAVIPERTSFGPNIKAWLWREEGKLDVLAEGDRLTIVDARCDGDRCLILTTHAGEVAAPGASLWVGDAAGPSDAYERTDILAGQVPDGAAPSSIAHWDASHRTAVVIFDGPKEVLFVRVAGKVIQESGKVAHGASLLGGTTTRDANVAVMTRGEPDDEGCVAGGAQVEVAVPGKEPVLIPAPVPPASGYALGVGTGAIVTWIAPLNCKAPKRKLVYGVLLGADGRPTSSTMALGDADGHAVTTKGNEVHVWLRDPKGVTWLRAECRPEAK